MKAAGIDLKEGDSRKGVIEMENKEKVAVFKSYLRRLMRDLIDLKKAIKEKNLEEAERLIDDLIEDTQKDIED